MTHEPAQSHATSLGSSPSADRKEQEPGAASRSALLHKPAHPIASGLLSRKARDANGVAEGAEHVVTGASFSTGSALPETLMRKFEGSLGADLSGVRVHTGSESVAANDAVGAKAYTLGTDIHFGAGQYDPSSPSGEHLLAHEVAHTVQQSGGASRVQFKLEVSAPGDAPEHEADSAADAMVAGRSASVSFGSGVQRKLYREANASMAPKQPVGPTSDPAELKQMVATVAATESTIASVKNEVNDFAATARTSLVKACGVLNDLSAIQAAAYTVFANTLKEGKFKAQKEHDETVSFWVQLSLGFVLEPLEEGIKHLTHSKALTKVIMKYVETAVAAPIEKGVSDATKSKLDEKLDLTVVQLDPLINNIRVATSLMRALSNVSEMQDLRQLESKPLSGLTMHIQAVADGKPSLDNQPVSFEKCQAEVAGLSNITAACNQTTAAVSAAGPKIEQVCAGVQAQKVLLTPMQAEQRLWLEWLKTLSPDQRKQAAFNEKIAARMVAVGVNQGESVGAQQLALQAIGRIAKVTTALRPTGKATVEGVNLLGSPFSFTARAYSAGFPGVEKAAGTYGTVLAVESGVLVIDANPPPGFIGQCDEPPPPPWAAVVE
jgi:Domain of unknown function (DUF4157)